MSRVIRLLATLLLLGGLVGCGGGGAGGGAESADGSGSGAGEGAVTSPTASASPTPLPVQTYSTVRELCGDDVEVELTTLPGPDPETAIAVAVLGEGPDVAVFLPQLGGALCGCVPYADAVATQGVRAVLVNHCGARGTTCSESAAADLQALVEIPIEWAREQGAERITLVGASMGGAIALGVGEAAGADAIVNVSGPPSWYGVPPLEEAAPALTVPYLCIAAKGDLGIPYDRVRSSVDLAGSEHAAFVEAPDGKHGWGAVLEGPALGAPLSPAGVAIRDWIRGDYG